MRNPYLKVPLLIWLQACLLGMTAIFTGCSEENELIEAAGTASINENSQLTKALDIADQFFSEFSNSTRSTKRTVKSVEKISNRLTRNANLGDSIYLVNYDNNQGFALLDIRSGAEEIYAISPEGALSINDTIGNPVLKDFFDGVMAYGVTPPSRLPVINDSITFSLDWKYLTTKRVARPLNDWVAEWNEVAYKKDCPKLIGSSVPTSPGSGAVAMAKILAYYKFPPAIKKLDGSDFPVNWGSIISTRNNDSVCLILPLLGQRDYGLSSKYTSKYTSTEPENFKDAFHNLNYWPPYFNMNRWRESEAKVISYMDKGVGKYKAGPIIAYAKKENSNNTEVTPFWIIDCIVEREKCLIDSSGKININSISKAPTLLHFVWGDGKTPNGYFAYLVRANYLQDSLDPNIYKPDNSITGKIPYTFKHLRIIGGWYSPDMK